MRTLPVGDELFHTGRHMTRPIVAYGNFANDPKNYEKIQITTENIPF
jgi:hypothetical protein